VLDGIVDYLPSPYERPPPLAYDEEGGLVAVQCDETLPVCALAFKVRLNVFYYCFVAVLVVVVTVYVSC
jgi:hypothetical protein